MDGFEFRYSLYLRLSGRSYLLCGSLCSRDLGGFHVLDNKGGNIRDRIMDFAEVETLLNANKIAATTPLVALQYLWLNRERLQIKSFVL